MSFNLQTSILLLAVTFANAIQASTAIAQDNSFLLVSMKILIVGEAEACRLQNGYDDIKLGTACPQLSADYVSALKGIVTETKPSPPGQIVSLGLDIFSHLNDYRETFRKSLSQTGEKPPLRDRKSVILIFDFGNPKQFSKKALDVVLERQQAGKDCKLKPSNIVEGKKCFVYKRAVQPDSQYLIYHEQAGSFIPTSQVRWTLSAIEQSTGKKYLSWTFETGR